MSREITRRGLEGAIFLKADTRWKIDALKDDLEKRHKYNFTYDMVVDWLADVVGPPGEVWEVPTKTNMLEAEEG